MYKFINTKEINENDLKIYECTECGTKHSIEYDDIRAPYKETGIENCKECGMEMLQWKSTKEPYLIRINE